MSGTALLHTDPELLRRAARVRLLALDVDGVLTDGHLYFSNTGDELKAFSTLDGQGIKLLQDSGVAVAVITARESLLVARRAENLGIRHLVQNCHDKYAALQQLLDTLGLTPEQAAYAGDDLPDLACITRVGLGISVPNGHASVRERAALVTRHAGGSGAVREVCDFIMAAQGTLDAAIERFLGAP